MREQLGINTAADLYRLGRDISEAELAGIVISGNSNLGGNAAKIIEQINTKRSLPLHIFLGSLGIEALGRREVEIAISKAPDELSTLADWRSDKLRDPELQNRINAPGKAEKWAAGIEANAALIDALLQQVTVVEPSDASETPSVASETACTVCITGTLPSGKKKAEYRAPLAARGFTLVDDVSADLGFLVVADPAKVSNKTEKVQKYNAKGSNIKIIGEDQLVAMIQ
jgi:NAD-dependent DNA ligase